MNRPEAFAFVAGGTVQAGGGVYIERTADRTLIEHCRAGDFTYILTSRQMGKSSLMIRTAERLAEEGARPVIIDLTEFGAQTTAEQWYKGLLFALQDQLGLCTSVSDWWPAQPDHAFGHRFTRYLREVALAERTERLVVFVDEIDTTLRLDFTDDFFAAIRFLYQNRAADTTLHRLSFVLIGVATPGDLIKDPARTPFNIAHRIELTDFTLAEACALVEHLHVPEQVGKDVIGWILRWTGGHPYLTLRAVRALAESPPPAWTAETVDESIRTLFLDSGGETDSNLQFVRDMLTKKAFDREAVLGTYLDVRRGRRVRDKELDQVTSWLKLSGIVSSRQSGQSNERLLRVRNAVYEQVFDERWTRTHLQLNVNWRRRLVRLAEALLVLTVLLTIPLALYAWRQKANAEYQTQQAQLERDEAERQRVIAENSLSATTAALETAQKLVDELKRVNPGSALAISAEITREREEAQKAYLDITAKLRSERDDALRKLEMANQRSTAPGGDVRARATSPKPADPKPVSKPASKPAPVTPPPPSADELAVRRVLANYAAAYKSRNIDALKRVQALSSAQANVIKSTFANTLDYQLTIDKEDVRFSADGRKAKVIAQVTRVITERSSVRQSSGLAIFTMERRGASWIILDVT
jgi:AAA-like domain